MIVPFRLQAVICAGVHHQTDVLLASRPGRTQDFVRGRGRSLLSRSPNPMITGIPRAR